MVRCAAFFKIFEGINKWFIVKNSPKGINNRRETALFVIVVYLSKKELGYRS